MFKLIVSCKSRESKIIKNVSLKQFFSGANRLKKKCNLCEASLDCVQFVISRGRFCPQCVLCVGGGAIFTWGYLKKNLYKYSLEPSVEASSCCVDSSSFQWGRVGPPWKLIFTLEYEEKNLLTPFEIFLKPFGKKTFFGWSHPQVVKIQLV